MKKIFLSLCTLAVVMCAFAQNDYKKVPSLGVHYVLYDFKTAADLRAKGLTGVLADQQYYRLSRMSAGMGLSYMQGLSNHLDFAATLNGAFVNYVVPNKPTSLNDGFLLDLTAMANLKLLSDKFMFSPYLSFGVGASKYKNYFAAHIPLGAGLQVNLKNEAFIQIQTQYRSPVTELANYHVYHSFGIVAPVGKKKEMIAPPPPPPAPVVEVPKDRDGDGIVDAEDNCPDVAGIKALKGCPDKDGDGITDADDKCPDVAGIASLQGCPDKDGDGIADGDDACPEVAGLARYKGCPIPDSDKDGVNDEEDKCINEAGPATNFGCPVIEESLVKKISQSAKGVYFATGSAKLLAKSFKPLNDVVKILNDNASFNLSVEGHTDNTGKEDKNLALSDARAAAVKAYLVSKGIAESRLTSKGFGQAQPVADNKTAAGRQLNRRVEMEARNY